MKRPHDFAKTEIPGLLAKARAGELVDLYKHCRIRISDRRAEVPRQLPFVPTFNYWMANRPGTTYFVPVDELSALYINILLTAFSPEFGYDVLDDRVDFEPPGLGRFAKSRGAVGLPTFRGASLSWMQALVPSAIGLGETGPLLRPFCPPYFRTMRDGGSATGWSNPARVQAGTPKYADVGD